MKANKEIFYTPNVLKFRLSRGYLPHIILVDLVWMSKIFPATSVHLHQITDI